MGSVFNLEDVVECVRDIRNDGTYPMESRERSSPGAATAAWWWTGDGFAGSPGVLGLFFIHRPHRRVPGVGVEENRCCRRVSRTMKNGAPPASPEGRGWAARHYKVTQANLLLSLHNVHYRTQNGPTKSLTFPSPAGSMAREQGLPIRVISSGNCAPSCHPAAIRVK